MNEDVLSKVSAKHAREVLQHKSPPERWQQLMGSKPRTLDFLDALLDEGEYTDAARFLALALPPREAVWWGCLCILYARARTMKSDDLAALRSAINWVRQNTHQHAYDARQAAQACADDSPAGKLAQAAYAAQPDPLAASSFDPGACAREVIAALRLSSKSDKPDGDILLRHFLVMGVAVASGKFGWTQEEVSSRRPPKNPRQSVELWTPDPES